MKMTVSLIQFQYGFTFRWIINSEFCDFIVVSEGEHEKVSKKELLLLGRRKEKKDKKDRGYATLDGESSPEEDFDTK